MTGRVLELAAALHFFGDVEPGDGALQGSLGPGLIKANRLPIAQTFLSAFPGSLSTGNINFLGPFGGIRQDNNAVRAYLEKAAGDGQRVVVTTFPHHQLAGLKDGHQRGVMGQNAQLALDAGGKDHIHIGGINDALSGDDIYLKT
jgi:hypothetical protein